MIFGILIGLLIGGFAGYRFHISVEDGRAARGPQQTPYKNIKTGDYYRLLHRANLEGSMSEFYVANRLKDFSVTIWPEARFLDEMKQITDADLFARR